MIIDVHYHAGTKVYGRFDFQIDRQWMKEEMEMSGVQKTIVFPYRAPGSYENLNKEIIESFANESILPFARLRLNFKKIDALKYLTKIKVPGLTKKVLRIIKEINNRKGIVNYKDEEQEKIRFSTIMEHCKGIKFHDNQDGHLHEKHFEFLVSFGKPIVLHINPYKLEYFLSLFETKIKAPIVIAHLGAGDADRIYLEKTRELLKRYDFLYTDIAAHVCANHLVPFLRETPKKVLFGSDGPVVSQGSTKYLILQTGRELFKDGDQALDIIKQNSTDFIKKSGWQA